MATDLASVAAELAPEGRLRAAINLGNGVLARNVPGLGPAGVAVDLARALGERLSLPVDLITYPTGGAVIPGLARGDWDVAFLAVEPERAALVAFTAPYVMIEATYLVRDKAAFRSVAELDRAGVRIATAKGAAYDLALVRELRAATLVRAATSSDAIALFKSERLDAAAGVRQTLVQAAAAEPGLRVLPDSFSKIAQGVALPKGRPLATRYVVDFVEAMKANGFVGDALVRHGQDAVLAAPARSALDV